MSFGTEITVHIRGLAYGGAGVGEVLEQNDGRSDLRGITAFVPYTAIGETVSARVSQRKERYVQAELLNILARSEDRVQPRCGIFTICGGCELQHLAYRAQLDAKSEMIRGAMRAAQFSVRDLEKLTPIVPGEEYFYRRRVTLHIDPAGRVGFYRNATRSVVPTDRCPVAVDSINEVMKSIQDFGGEVKGKVSTLLLEADDAGVIAVLKSPYDLSQSVARGVLTSARKFFPNAFLVAADKEIDGYGRQILEIPLHEHRTFTLRVPAGFFSQVNAGINTKLVSRAVQLAALKSGEAVLDLYAGAGNFSLPLARGGASVTAVECDSRLVALGRENASRHGLKKQLEFLDLSVEKYLKMAAKNSPPALLVADPPRSGLGPLLPQLPPAARFILVSCHLPSFVRDAKGLIEQGYTLESVIPYDMFAQTSYVEILSVFRRSAG